MYGVTHTTTVLDFANCAGEGCGTGVCRVSESGMYSTAWHRMYILTPYTPVYQGQ